MKTAARLHFPRRRAVALVIVLASLVLLAALALAFLASVSTELKSSRTYSAGTSARLLAQTAIHLATAQITQGTKGVDASGRSLAWASQPGMIRTYDSAGRAAGYFKLYSWTEMTGSGSYDPVQPSQAVPADWASSPAVFVDLNAPLRMKTPAGTNVIYPILDGNGLVTMAAVGGNKTYGANNLPAVEGFFVSTNAPVENSATANPVPMPVKWLYVLADGGVVAAEPGPAGLQARVPGASSGNPIIGRIAFWADDETCKININTASDGVFSDTPRTYSAADWTLAQNQPLQWEYQRYPGHPATTSLSAFLRKPASGFTDQQWSEVLYGFTPRVSGGGSAGGTIRTANVTPPPSPISLDGDRLYTSVDELVFRPALNGTTRRLNDPTATADDPATATVLTRDQLARARFFLTASSRSPDLNLFNEPRVSIWPTTLDRATAEPLRTPFDALISFCATANGHEYFFRRQNPDDPVNDLPVTATGPLARNRTLLEYLRTLTETNIPGFGGNFLTKYGDDRSQILTEIFDYIRSTNLRDSSLWGTGAAGTTANSWTGEFTRNLALSLNPSSDTYKALPGVGQVVPIEDGATRGFGRFPTVQGAFLQFIGMADEETNPIDAVNAGGTVITNAAGAPRYPRVNTGRLRVQAGFFVSLFDPSVGQVINKPWYAVEVEGLDAFGWSADSQPAVGMGFPALADLGRPIPYNLSHQTFFGGNLYYLSLAKGKGFSANKYPLLSGITGSAGQAGDFPKGGVFDFSGGDVTIRLYRADSSGARTGPPLQTVQLNFPSEKFPVPRLAPVAVRRYSGYPATFTGTMVNFRSFLDDSGTPAFNPPHVPVPIPAIPARTGRFNADETMPIICSADVVRAVVASPGDIRLIAAQKTPPKTLFAPHPFYGNQAVLQAHNLKTGAGYTLYGCSAGKLANVTYPTQTATAGRYLQNDQTDTQTTQWGITGSAAGSTRDTDNPSPAGVTQTNGGPADWDNGIGNLRDGPYINKPDEGDVGNSVASPYFGFEYTQANNLPGATLFSPNRLIPSAGMFGSLPTGVLAGRPWQTLQFRPGPEGHPGLGVSLAGPGDQGPPYATPPDHLLLDLFHMPVVEPYAISEPLSTAGRVNLNQQIVPFTYLNRDTGLRAVLKSERLTSIPDTNSAVYKTTQTGNGQPAGAYATTAFRVAIDADATLLQVQRRFAGGDIFRAASEICGIDLVPANAPAATRANPTRQAMDAYWAARKLTGDNSREKAYATIYPRLTTKSNTFSIFYRAQSLQKAPGGTAEIWDESRDRVTGESRGQQTVERYLDPNQSGIPDYADPATTTPISQFYKLRVIQAKPFAP